MTVPHIKVFSATNSVHYYCKVSFVTVTRKLYQLMIVVLDRKSTIKRFFQIARIIYFFPKVAVSFFFFFFGLIGAEAAAESGAGAAAVAAVLIG